MSEAEEGSAVVQKSRLSYCSAEYSRSVTAAARDTLPCAAHQSFQSSVALPVFDTFSTTPSGVIPSPRTMTFFSAVRTSKLVTPVHAADNIVGVTLLQMMKRTEG